MKDKEGILDDIDWVTDPNHMTPEQAIEFLDLLIDDLKVRVESLKEENDL